MISRAVLRDAVSSVSMPWDFVDAINAIAAIKTLIDEAPAVDAVPVEWLEEHDSEGNEFGRRYITVVEALSMWQMEQEAR